MDSEKIRTLFERTLVGNYESDDAWAAVGALHIDGSREIFEHAAEWCYSDEPLKRARAAAILGQLQRARAPQVPNANQERMFREESYALISTMLGTEQDPVVVDSAICALGHLANLGAVPLVLQYQNHPDQDVRFAVAFALGCFPNDPQSISGLVKLTLDSSSDVRDWAVFGLGVLGDADSPEIRDALLRCVNDADEDVREEAAVGLGKRGDPRLIPKLRSMLSEPELKARVAEAAAALLGLKKDIPEWAAADYKKALSLKFDLQD